MLGDCEAIERVTGSRPPGCPWRVFYDPDVVAVLRAYDFWESGQCAEYWGNDPELWLVEGVRVYHNALARARADTRKIEREQREHANRAKAGLTIRG